MKKNFISLLIFSACSLASFSQNVTNYGTSTGTSGNLNSYFGYSSGNASTSSTAYNQALGAYSLFKNTGNANVAFGYAALYQNVSGLYNTAVGHQALNNNTSNYNSALGLGSLAANTTGGYNTAIGYNSLNANTTASYSTAIGLNSLKSSTGSNNTGMGVNTLYAVSSGTDNTAGGYTALQNNTASFNTAYGSNSLFMNSSGANLAAGGYRSLYANTTGSNNTAFGYQALQTNTTGSNNTAIGYGADVSTASLTNATAIGNGALATLSNSMQLGNTAVTQVFVGSGTVATLVAGGLKITGGTLGAGKVLTSDANGVATWQTPTGGGGSQWTTSGTNIYYNSGTVGIGTATPNASYKLDINGGLNSTAFYVAGVQQAQWNVSGTNASFGLTGNIGIGTTQPDYKLTVNGTVHCTELKVTSTVPAPDYVFEKDYKLRSLNEVEKYIDKFKHLPEVPSAKEMDEKGISVGEMNLLLLKKVEELTLYLIDLKKENESLRSRIEIVANKN